MEFTVSNVMKVSPEDVYDYLIDSVAKQITATTGVEMRPEDVKAGYRQKTQSQPAKGKKPEVVKFTLSKAERPSHIRSVYTSAYRKTVVDYVIEPSPSGSKMIYTQTIEFTDPSKEPKGFKAAVTNFRTKNHYASELSLVEKEVKKWKKAKEKEESKKES